MFTCCIHASKWFFLSSKKFVLVLEPGRLQRLYQRALSTADLQTYLVKKFRARAGKTPKSHR